jgi:hypothetical protein
MGHGMTQIPPAEYEQQRAMEWPADDAEIGVPEEEAGPRISRLAIPLLIVVGKHGSGILFLLGYVARRMANEGSLAFTIRATNGWKFWLPGLALAAVTGAATLFCYGRYKSLSLPRATAWIFPAVAIGAGLMIIAVYHDRRWWYIAPVVVWLAILVGTIARALLAEHESFGHDVARTSLTVVTYVVTFILLAMIYINKLRSVYSASAVAFVCILLLLQLTDGEEASLTRRLVYAIAGGLIVGQVTWVINYWSATGWTGGAFLLAVFYLIGGLSAAQLRGGVQVFDVVEFGGVALIAIAIVSAAVWFQT